MQEFPILKRQIEVSLLQAYKEIAVKNFPNLLKNEQILFEWDIDVNNNINDTDSDIKYYRLGYLERTDDDFVWETKYEYGRIEDIKRTFAGSVV